LLLRWLDLCSTRSFGKDRSESGRHTKGIKRSHRDSRWLREVVLVQAMICPAVGVNDMITALLAICAVWDAISVIHGFNREVLRTPGSEGVVNESKK
jgi:hypothetical protein